MANKVFNMAGGLHSAAAYSAFEDALYGSSVATSTDFVATAGTGMNVSLSAGNGLISTGSGYARRIASDAVNTISISAAASTSRIDSIVAYIDNSVTPVTSVVDNTNNILKFVAVAGTAAANPSAPTAAAIQSAIGAGNPYMVLWNVTVPANATALTNAVFTDRRTIASNLAAINALRTELDSFKASMTISSFSTASISSVSGFTLNTADLTLAQSSDGSVFKLYGQMDITNTSTSAKRVPCVAVPGASGRYGFDTGLVLNATPTSAFTINPAGVRGNHNTALTNCNNITIAAVEVGTNGHIYIYGTGNSTGLNVDASTRVRIVYPPCVYYNSNFGDQGGDD